MAATYLHVTVAGAGTKDGTTWLKAMDLAAFLTHVTNTVAADTFYFIQGGATYTLGATFSSIRNGTAAAPIRMIGVKSTTSNEGAAIVYSDWALTTGRPIFDAVSYAISLTGSYYQFENLIITGTNATLLTLGTRDALFNCKVTNTSVTADQTAISSGTSNFFVGTEISCHRGNGLLYSGLDVRLHGCYIHDCKYGLYTTTGTGYCVDNVIESCLWGIYMTTGTDGIIKNNTIRNCNIGLYGTTGYASIVDNNLFADCVTPIDFTTEPKITLFVNNCEYGCTNVDTGATHIGLISTDCKLTSIVGKGTDGACNANTAIFTSASAPFASVTTSDCLVLFSGTGTGIIVGCYGIVSVDSTSQLTLDIKPVDSSHALSAGVFGVVKGSDFTVAKGSSCIDAGLSAKTYSGVTV